MSAFLFFGYHFGERWKTAIEIVDRNLKGAVLVAGILLALYAALHYGMRRRKAGPRP